MKAVEETVSVSDWHATLLHLLGLDFAKLFVHKNGFEERLVGVEEPEVVSSLLA